MLFEITLGGHTYVSQGQNPPRCCWLAMNKIRQTHTCAHHLVELCKTCRVDQFFSFFSSYRTHESSLHSPPADTIITTSTDDRVFSHNPGKTNRCPSEGSGAVVLTARC